MTAVLCNMSHSRCVHGYRLFIQAQQQWNSSTADPAASSILHKPCLANLSRQIEKKLKPLLSLHYSQDHASPNSFFPMQSFCVELPIVSLSFDSICLRYYLLSDVPFLT